MPYCVLLLAVGFLGDESAAPSETEKAKLRAELHAMVEKDQAARKQMIAAMQKSGQTNLEAAKKRDDAELKRVLDLDRQHTARLKEIVDKFGWPGKSLVGADGAHDAWLLVQHADLDRAFQKRCLELMQAAAKKDEVSKQELAYLTDRVLVGEGKKQRYGTQFTDVKGEMVPQPIDDEANVDQRRADIGLPSLAEYKKQIEEMYKKKPQPK